MLPALSTTTPWAAPMDALVASPPSPELPRFPLPATVVIIPPVWQNKGAASSAIAASGLLRNKFVDMLTPTAYANRRSQCAKRVGRRKRLPTSANLGSGFCLRSGYRDRHGVALSPADGHDHRNIVRRVRARRNLDVHLIQPDESGRD